MGRDDHGAPLVCRGDFVQGLKHALPHVLEGLGSGEAEVCRVVQEGIHQLRLLPEKIGKGPGLPGTDINLPQASVRLHGQIVVFCDGGGGEARTPEVAGVNGVHRDRAKALGQGVPLPYSERRHVPVPVPLHVAVEIALGLDVPNYINFCHKPAS